MEKQTSIIVTSIAAPNAVLRSLAAGCVERGLRFYVIGDVPSPKDFSLAGCDFYDLDRQRASDLRFAVECPTRHYARKNIGYLLAIRDRARVIVETDDDNFPRPEFWGERRRRRTVALIRDTGWVNVYRYFTDANIWPRGLPLDAVNESRRFDGLESAEIDAPIQQGLADDNPDVDAIYRMILPLPLAFAPERRVGLAKGSWCPFNSQNTTWWPDAYALLYLPAYCSFRMTDIWRSFIAQRIAWENGWSLLFESPTVWQQRNEHNLMRDFQDEVPGYLHNRAIGERLDALTLRAGVEHIAENLRLCYEALIRAELIGKPELTLLEAWLSDLQSAQGSGVAKRAVQ